MMGSRTRLCKFILPVLPEFGDLTGQLSLWIKTDNGYQKEILLNQPGSIRTLAQDMNRDGKSDLVVLTTQGDESITILYQEANLKFRAEKPIRFSPVYGSSWFELVDYDNDGDQDIITVHGDNADKTNVANLTTDSGSTSMMARINFPKSIFIRSTALLDLCQKILIKMEILILE